jgi:hypothetical protein
MVGQTPGIDPAPRIFGRGAVFGTTDPEPVDRYTWCCGEEAIGARGDSHCELRWTTEKFTLIDPVLPAGLPRLYDRLLDPEERLDRAFGLDALADSLRQALRERLYGETPVLVIRAGDRSEILRIHSRTRLAYENRFARDQVLRLAPGEAGRLSLFDGAASLHFDKKYAFEIGGDEFMIDRLILHSRAWRSAAENSPPEDPGPGLQLWLERSD